MSVMTKLLPIAALGIVGAMNSDAIKENLDIIGRAKVAATSGIEMRNIADAVAIEFSEKQRLPLLNFGVFLKANTEEKGGEETRDRSKDMWKTPYRIVMNHPESGFEIWSAGPDRYWGNDDDLRYLYVLSGPDVKSTLARQAREWQRLVAHYRQLDASQGDEPSPGGEAVAASEAAEAELEALAGDMMGQAKAKVSDAELKRYESQMKRAESGSTSAMLSVAERLMKGDSVVEKDAGQAKQFLEKVIATSDSQIIKSKAENLLRLVNAELE